MKKLPAEVIQFFQSQGFVIVSTVDKKGFLHSSCKGIVKISPSGKIYLLDLYRAGTHENLKCNPHISITAVNEHRFVGYCLKGKAKIMRERKLSGALLRAWEEGITSRLTQRVLKNIHEEKGHPGHPESLLPNPQYLIVMQVKEIIDLKPRQP